MTRSHAVSSFLSHGYLTSFHMLSRISPPLNWKPGGFFFLREWHEEWTALNILWGSDMSKDYNYFLWLILLYWHAMGNFRRICSSWPEFTFLLFLLLFISKVKSLRMMSWGWGAEVWIKICFPYQTDHSYSLFPWWAVASIFETRGLS